MMFWCSSSKSSTDVISPNLTKSTKKTTKGLILTKSEFVTTRQQQAIVTVWDNIQDHTTLWQTVYLQIFMHKPSLKGLFRFRHLPADRLQNDPYFHHQCYLMQNFMAQLVRSMKANKRQEIDDLCKHVGRRHAHLTTVRFEPDWWILFISSTIDQLKPLFDALNVAPPPNVHLSSMAKIGQALLNGAGGHYQTSTKEAREAWLQFLEYIVESMSNEFYITKAQLEMGETPTERYGSETTTMSSIYNAAAVQEELVE